MPTEPKAVLDFLEEQKSRQASRFPAIRFDKVLSFMGTTSQPGSFARLSVHRLMGLEPAHAQGELRIRLAGPLPRTPGKGELLTVHITRPERYRGYQVKTRAVGADGATEPLYAGNERSVLVRGWQVYTVHQSPYTMTSFTDIPFEEVSKIANDARCALVGLGERANISPRFVFHHEITGGRLALYHGDGLALKTYMNLQVNRHETRLVLDLETFTGYALEGIIEEIRPEQYPDAYHRICQGFTTGNWGTPSRVFRLMVDQSRPIGPAD